MKFVFAMLVLVASQFSYAGKVKRETPQLFRCKIEFELKYTYSGISADDLHSELENLILDKTANLDQEMKYVWKWSGSLPNASQDIVDEIFEGASCLDTYVVRPQYERSYWACSNPRDVKNYNFPCNEENLGKVLKGIPN